MVEPIVVTDRPGRRLRIRLALDNVVVTESHYGAGEHGPRPHVHRLHADCFYVIEGALTLSGVGFLATAEDTLDAIGLVEYAAPPLFPGFRELATALDGGQRDPAVIAQISSRYDMMLA